MIALYIRVSTDEQAQTGYSLEFQKERLEAYCKSQGWDEYQLYNDDGYTGKDMDRPALQRMMRDVKDGKIQAVVVYRLDRLARRQKHVLYLLEDVFDKHGAIFKSATEPFDTSTAFGKAMLGILAVFAQLERDTIIERLSSGLRTRVKNGLWRGGPNPFGYAWNKEKQVLEIVPEQAKIVSTIFEKYIRGESLGEIAVWASKRYSNFHFEHFSVKRILTRQVYMGKVINGDVVANGDHEKIVSEETFNRAQMELQIRTKGDKQSNGLYLLSGLVRCGVCGGAYSHLHKKARGKDYFYYDCAKKNRRYKGTTTCKIKGTPQHVLEEIIVQQFKDMLMNQERLKKNYDKIKSDQKDFDRIVKSLKDKLPAIERKIKRWHEAYLNEAITAAEMRDYTAELKRDRENILQQIAEVENQAPDTLHRESVLAHLKTVVHNWDYMTLEEQRAILRTAIKKIIIRDNEDPEIIWNI